MGDISRRQLLQYGVGLVGVLTGCSGGGSLGIPGESSDDATPDPAPLPGRSFPVLVNDTSVRLENSSRLAVSDDGRVMAFNGDDVARNTASWFLWNDNSRYGFPGVEYAALSEDFSRFVYVQPLGTGSQLREFNLVSGRDSVLYEGPFILRNVSFAEGDVVFTRQQTRSGVLDSAILRYDGSEQELVGSSLVSGVIDFGVAANNRVAFYEETGQSTGGLLNEPVRNVYLQRDSNLRLVHTGPVSSLAMTKDGSLAVGSATRIDLFTPGGDKQYFYLASKRPDGLPHLIKGVTAGPRHIGFVVTDGLAWAVRLGDRFEEGYSVVAGSERRSPQSVDLKSDTLYATNTGSGIARIDELSL